MGQYDVDPAILDVMGGLPALPKPNLWYFQNFADRMADIPEFVTQLIRITGSVGVNLFDSQRNLDAALTAAADAGVPLHLQVYPFNIVSGDSTLTGRSAISGFVRDNLAELRRRLGKFADLATPPQFIGMLCEQWGSYRTKEERLNRHTRYVAADMIVAQQFPDASVGWYHYAPQFNQPGHLSIWSGLFDRPSNRADMLGEVMVPELYVPWCWAYQEAILQLALSEAPLRQTKIRPIVSLVGQYSPPPAGFEPWTLPARKAGWTVMPPPFPGYHLYQLGRLLHNLPDWSAGRTVDRIQAVWLHCLPPYLSAPPDGFPNRWAIAFAYFVLGALRRSTAVLEGIDR